MSSLKNSLHCLLLCGVLIGICPRGMAGDILAPNEIQEDINFLRERQIDFKKDRIFLSEMDVLTREQKLELKNLLNDRASQKKLEEKQRQSFVFEHSREIELSAVRREAIEQKLQDQEDFRQLAIEKQFVQLLEKRQRQIAKAHLEISENLEYDLHIPIKKDHAKPRTKSSKR